MTRRVLIRDEEVKLMVHCAQLYYDQTQELSQADVAARLGINPTKVSRLLHQAQMEGIIKVAIDPPRLQRLELELMDTFDLKEVVVVPSGEDRAYDAVGKAAAEYFIRAAQDDISIGLAPGFSIQRMIEYLQHLPFNGHRLYPMAAESTAILRHFYPTQLAALMMTKYRRESGVEAYTYRIPNRPDEPGKWADYKSFLNNLIKDKAFVGLLEKAGKTDIILSGIGAVAHPDPALAAFFEAYDLSSEKCGNMGAVGMMNYHFFDSQGKIITAKDCPELEPMESSVVRIGLDEFSRAAKSFGRLVIALAGGSHKTAAVRAALRGRFFNVLITDINVAEGLLKEQKA